MLDDIRSACQQHGAKAVSDAAYAAIEGRTQTLQALGLGHVQGLAALHQLTQEAFELMSPEEKAVELANGTLCGPSLS